MLFSSVLHSVIVNLRVHFVFPKHYTFFSVIQPSISVSCASSAIIAITATRATTATKACKGLQNNDKGVCLAYDTKRD